MSSSIAFYVADTKQVASHIACGDLSLVGKLKDALPEYFENDDPDDDEMSLQESLKAIVQGDLSNEEADYLRAIEVLCAYHGTEEILDSLQECRGGFLEQLIFLKQAFATPIPIPISIEGDEEHTLFIGREEIGTLCATLANQQDAEVKREVYSAQIEFLDLLRSVEESSLDLVGFCQ